MTDGRLVTLMIDLTDRELRAARSAHRVDRRCGRTAARELDQWIGEIIEDHSALRPSQRAERVTAGPDLSGRPRLRSFEVLVSTLVWLDRALADDHASGRNDLTADQ